MNTHRQAERPRVEDEYDFYTEFMFDPDLPRLGFDPDKFKHINKNLQVTALTKGEADRVLRFLRKVQILHNYNKTVYKIRTAQGWKELDEQTFRNCVASEEVDNKRLSRDVTNRFQDAIDFFYGEIFGQTSVASGTNSALLRNTNTRIQEQKQDITEEQKTGADGNWSTVRRYMPGSRRNK
jgi:hypothetical protein